MSDSRDIGEMDPEALIAQVERDVLAAEERAASATRLVELLQTVEGEGESRRREVRVRVDSSGRLIGIKFQDASASLSRSELEAAVMEAAEIAQRKAANAAVHLAEESDVPGVAMQLRGAYEQRLGSLDDEDDGSGDDRERRPN